MSYAAHDPPELLEADLPVVVHIGLADHLQDLVRLQLVPEQLRHHAGQLERCDVAVVVLVEQLERLFHALLVVRVGEDARHGGQEFGEVDAPVAVLVPLGHARLDLLVRDGALLAQTVEDLAELGRRDKAVIVLVKVVESLLDC